MGSNGAEIRNQSADIFDRMCQPPEGDSRTMPGCLTCDNIIFSIYLWASVTFVDVAGSRKNAAPAP